jgi:hypothetical protein
LLLPSGVGANVGWLKLRSGTRAMPVAQEADRAFTPCCNQALRYSDLFDLFASYQLDITIIDSTTRWQRHG